MKCLRCIVATTLLLAGCPKDVDDPIRDDIGASDLVIGLIQPLATGSELAREQAARLAVQEINRAGGVNGQQLALKVEFDNNNDPATGVSAARALLSHGVIAVIGANASRVTLPVAEDVTIPAAIALVSQGSTSPLISALDDNDTVYRIPPSDALQGRLLAQKLWDEGFDRAAVFSQEEPYGQGLRDAFSEQFLLLGGSLMAEATAPVQTTSGFGADINALYAAGTPEALLIFAFDETTGNLVREILASRGSLPPLFGVDGNLTSSLLENAPLQIEGMRGTIPGAALDRPQFVEFARLFQRATGVPVSDPNTGNTYDAVYLIALALAQAGTNSRSAVIDHLRSVSIADTGTPVAMGPGQIHQGFDAIATGADLDYQGVANDIDFDAQGDPSTATYQYVRVVRTGSQLSLQILETVNFP